MGGGYKVSHGKDILEASNNISQQRMFLSSHHLTVLNETVSAGDTAITLHTLVPYTQSS